MLEIKTKLLTVFYPQMDKQIRYMNQELEQYLQFFVNHRQKNQLKQLNTIEFIVNNNIHSATRVSLIITNYKRKLRIEVKIKRKEKVEKMIVRIVNNGLDYILFLFSFLLFLSFFSLLLLLFKLRQKCNMMSCVTVNNNDYKDNGYCKI